MNKEKERPVWQRTVALIAVIVLAVMILATLICAIAGAGKNVVMALLFCDIIIPILVWVFLWVTGIYKKKGENLADEYNKLNSNNEEKKND